MENAGIYSVIGLGGSRVVTIPARCAKVLAIEPGDLVKVTWDNEQMTIKKAADEDSAAEG